MKSEKKHKILVVDDEVYWLKKINRILQADYTLTLTDNPSEALEILKENDFALVILDMKLPSGVSGLEVYSQMREISPDLRAIILTGHPDIDSMRKSFKKGFLDYIEKGTTQISKEIKAVVAEILSRGSESIIIDLIASGESEVLEFKSTARWDVRAKRPNKELEKVIVKTIAAFLNSENGGILLIGVDDDGNILGLADDYKTLGRRQDSDGYENLLTTILFDSCGKECSPLIKIIFHQIEDKEICQISVKPSPKPIFVKDDKNENFYVRTGNSTRMLSTREAIEYCKIHWSI